MVGVQTDGRFAALRCRATELTQASVALRQAEGTWVLLRPLGGRRRQGVEMDPVSQPPFARRSRTAPSLLSHPIASRRQKAVLHWRP